MKSFSSEENEKSHLECEHEILGIKADNRYQKKGDIAYKELSGILPKEIKEMLKDKIKDDEYISLYKREFIGIDKECYEKWEINLKNLRKNQQRESNCLLAESIVILNIIFVPLILALFIQIKGINDEAFHVEVISLIIFLLTSLAGVICQSLFFGKTMKYSKFYYCSDEIVNEILSLEDQYTEKDIILTAINLGTDIFYLLFNTISILIIPLIQKRKKEFYLKDNDYYNYIINTNRKKINL